MSGARGLIDANGSSGHPVDASGTRDLIDAKRPRRSRATCVTAGQRNEKRRGSCLGVSHAVGSNFVSLVAVWPVLSKLRDLADSAGDQREDVLRPDDPTLVPSVDAPPNRRADIISSDDSQLNPPNAGPHATVTADHTTDTAAVAPSRRGYRARPLTPDALAEALCRYQSGETLKAIAADIGISREFLTNQLRTVPGFVARRRSLTDDEVCQSVYLYGTGLSVASIGQRLGFNGGTIWLALRRAAVPMRDAQGQER